MALQFKSKRRMKCIHGQLTLAQVKAGTVILAAEPGRTITVWDGWLRSAGAATTATSVDVTDTAGTPIVAFKMAVGGLGNGVLARVGVATHYTGTTVGTPLTPGKGLRIVDAAKGSLTVTTALDYCLMYTVES